MNTRETRAGDWSDHAPSTTPLEYFANLLGWIFGDTFFALPLAGYEIEVILGVMQGTTVYATCFVNTGGKGHTVGSFHRTRKAAERIANVSWAHVRAVKAVIHPDGTAEALPGELWGLKCQSVRAPYRG